MLTLLNKIRSFRHFDLIFSICTILIGLLTFFFPSIAIYILSIGLGVFLLGFGIEGMIRLIRHKGSDLSFFIRLLGTLLSIFGALGLLFFGTLFAGFVCNAVGIFLLIDASVKLFDLLACPRQRTPSFWIRLSISALTFILGLALLITPTGVLLGALRLLGIALSVEGASSLVYAALRLRADSGVKQNSHDPIETSFTDRTET